MKQCWKKIRICVPQQDFGVGNFNSKYIRHFHINFWKSGQFWTYQNLHFSKLSLEENKTQKNFLLFGSNTGTFFWSPCTWSFPFESFSQTIIDKAGKQFCDDYFNLFLPTLHDRDKWSISLCSKGSSEGCWQRSWQVCWGFGYLRREHWQIGSSHTFYLILQAFFILIYKF